MRQVIFAALVSAAGFSTVPARSQEVPASETSSKPVSRFKKELERGYRLKAQKRDVEAIAVFAAVLAKDPGDHAALTELGYLHADLKHYASAAKYLGAASAQDPDNMRLHMDLGYASQALKRYAAAGEQFRLVAEHAGEFQQQAEKALESVTVSTPTSSAADARQRRLLERGYAALNRGDKAAAAKSFAAAVANDPKDTAALKQLGFIDLDMGRIPEAAANFEAARALEPSDYFVALQLGYTYERLQKTEQAREAFDAALASTDEKIRGAAQAALHPSVAAAPASSL